MASFKNSNLNILQWNCRSVIPKIDRLKALIANFDIDIFCLNETWLIDTKFFRILSFNIIRKDRNIAYGGVMIGIRENIEFKFLNFIVDSPIGYFSQT